MTYFPTSKIMKRAPDYDSGCVSVAADTTIDFTHNLGTRKLNIQLLYGYDDSDCTLDAAEGSQGRPYLYLWTTTDFLMISCRNDNTLSVKNQEASTRYFRILIWKGE